MEPETQDLTQPQLAWQVSTDIRPRYLFALPNCICLAADKAMHLFSAENGQQLSPPLTMLGDWSLAEHVIVGGTVTPSGVLLLTTVSNESGAYHLSAVKPLQGNTHSLERAWFYKTPGSQLSAPMVHLENVYVIERLTTGHNLIIFDCVSGQMQNSRRLMLSDSDNPYLDCASLAFVSDRLYLSLCDGRILHLDLQTGQGTLLFAGSEEFRASPMATNGRALAYRTWPTRDPLISGRLYIWDIALQHKQLREIKMSPDLAGRRKPGAGRPMMLNGIMCTLSGRDTISLYDVNSGQEQWSEQMLDRIETPPTWAGEAVVVADRAGNVRALQFGKPEFRIVYHYDIPPTFNRPGTLKFNVLNIGYRIAENAVLRVWSEDFEGISEHNTQTLHTILPGKYVNCEVVLTPRTNGSTLHVPLIIDYKYARGRHSGSQKIDLSIPIERGKYEATNVSQIPSVAEFWGTLPTLTNAVHSTNKSGIPANLFHRLRKVLLRTNVFASNLELRAIFVDPRLHAWQSRLPEANSMADRVMVTIAFLHDQYNVEQENALILLLRVLSEQINPRDRLHLELIELIDELQFTLSTQPVEPETTGQPAQRPPGQSDDSYLSACDTSEAYHATAARISMTELERLFTLSRGVGKLEVRQYAQGEPVWGHMEAGTAWLIAPGLALTCWHVLETRRYPGSPLIEQDLQKQIENARLVLGFVGPGQGCPYAVKLAHANRDKDTLDYAILELQDWDNACDYLPIDARAPLGTSTELRVVHHPLARPHEIAFGPCLGPAPTLGRIAYRLDTEPGSSGGPVFDAQSLRVVAMHRGRGRNTHQEGIRLSAILEDLSGSPDDQVRQLGQKIAKDQKEKGGRQ